MLFTTAEVLLFLTVARFLWFLVFLWLFFFFFLLHVFLFSPWILSLSKEKAGAFMLQLSAGPSGAFQMERVSIGPGFSSSVHIQTGRRRREEGGSLRRMLGARSEGLCIHPISVKKVETKRGQQEAVEIGHVSDILASVINSSKARNLQ